MTLEEARKEMIYFENGTSGSFMTKLIEATYEPRYKNHFDRSK